MRVEVETGKESFASLLRNLGEGYFRAAQEATADQTEETKRHARLEAARGLERQGRGNFANTIRSRWYPEGPAFDPGNPAGFVHSTWGHRSRRTGEFVDILAVHETGAVIRPIDRDALFIPFPGTRRLRRGVSYNTLYANAQYIPAGNGVFLRDRDTGRLLGKLVQSVTIPKRLDFDWVRREAQEGLMKKLLVEFARAEVHAARVQGRPVPRL